MGGVATLEFGILGQLELRRDGQPVHLGGHRQRAVLALLVIDSNRVVSIDRFLDEMWGQEPPAGAMTTLQAYISKLRRILEPGRPAGTRAEVLCTEPPGYLLRLEPEAIDARRFERLAREGRDALAAGGAEAAATVFDDALALWRGPALADFAFEPFAASEAARLEELRLAVTEDQLETALVLGQHRTVVADLEQLVAVHPLRERLRAHLMLALYRSGRQAEALRAYQAGRRILGEELGIEPNPALKALENAVLLQDPSLDWAPPARVPHPTAPSAAGRDVVLGDGSREARGGTSPASEPAQSGLRPSETLTFLLSGVDGSDRLWTEHPAVAGAALVRHQDLAADVLSSHGGILPGQSDGDSILAVFPRASDAVAAALGFQRALSAESWPGGAVVRVRIGLHTGEAVVREGTYYGLTINRGVRLRDLAHGGQVLCSQATAQILADHLPPGSSLRDLGLHRLRDLDRPEQVFQLCHPDLASEFPPLISARVPPHNLPVALTSFVGRQQEVAEVKKLLEGARLVTLVGGGGVGKTRLALQVAAETVAVHRDGTWLADLAPLVDPGLVPHAIATALDVHEEPGQPLVDALVIHLRSRSLLLVVDNCEHLAAACAGLVARLLAAAPEVRVLATSQEPLRVAGEVAWRVPSLSTPVPGEVSSLDDAQEYEAIRLFLERARAARPQLELRAEDVPVLVQICTRLDGIPLAIELAAARVSVLALDQVADRLEDRFRLLASGPRSALSRHQTLRAAVDWSYELLGPGERDLLRRLSVFAGSFGLEAAEVVGSGPKASEAEVLDLLDSLVAKSLVAGEPMGSEVRYRLLETIRHYAREKLTEAGEEPEAAMCHQRYYLALAEEAEAETFSAGAGRVLDRLEAEHDNFRAALERAVSDPGARQAGLLLAHALFPFWEVRDHRQEGRAWMEALLARPGPPEAIVSAVARRAGNLAWTENDQVIAGSLWERALEIARRCGDRRHLGRALLSVARLARSRGELASAEALLEESHGFAREVGDELFVAESLLWLGWVAYDQARYAEAKARGENSWEVAGESWFHITRILNLLGCVGRQQADYPLARRCFEECRELSASVDDRVSQAEALDGLASVAAAQGRHSEARQAWEDALMLVRTAPSITMVGPLGGLGELASAEGDHGAACSLLEEELRRARDAGDPSDMASALIRLGQAALLRADSASAASAYGEALAFAHRSGMPWHIAASLEGLASSAVVSGQPDRAARLLARAGSLREGIGAPLMPSARPAHEQTMARARADLGEAPFVAAWAEAWDADLDDVVAIALGKGLGATPPA
jgi:predicted ATPase/DNA-binding SARP family transcriptional activator